MHEIAPPSETVGTAPLRAGLRGLAAVLIAVALARGAMIATGQRYLRSDEAVVGLMARHIVTRGERPLFLYGQTYGGGHAMLAYAAAPLFAVFGSSGALLTALTAAVSLLNVALVWAILRRLFGEPCAVTGAALYGFSPPVVYQSVLVNGGNESFALALIALWFFLRAYRDGVTPVRHALLAGVFAGLGYYAMDYALLYAIVFVALWMVTGRRDKWRALGAFAAGFAIGCAPLILYNLTHDFAHVRGMARGGAESGVPFPARCLGALRDAVTGDLAAFFSGEIDDFNWAAVGPGAWMHMGIALAAVAWLACSQRRFIAQAFRRISFAGRDDAPLPAELLPLVFIAVYMGIYSASRFSTFPWRTPRYFLPLCPFVSMVIVWAALRQGTRWRRTVGWALAAFLVVRGVWFTADFGARPWHEEHHIRTSGREVDALGRWLVERRIGVVFAPYEIQWRLMFATDEAVLAASDPISPLPRYAWYGEEVRRRIAAGESFALVFRNDFAFAAAAGARVDADGVVHLRGMRLDPRLMRAHLNTVGEEFVVIGPLPPESLRGMLTGSDARM